jgi:hypothetical protein
VIASPADLPKRGVSIAHLRVNWPKGNRAPESTIATPSFLRCCDERQLAPVREAYLPSRAKVVAVGVDPHPSEFEDSVRAWPRGEIERFPNV